MMSKILQKIKFNANIHGTFIITSLYKLLHVKLHTLTSKFVHIAEKIKQYTKIQHLYCNNTAYLNYSSRAFESVKQ